VLGTKLKVVGEQPVGGTYMATVEVIDPIIDATSSTFGIRLLLPNPDHKIPAGLRCKWKFPGRIPAARIPERGRPRRRRQVGRAKCSAAAAQASIDEGKDRTAEKAAKRDAASLTLGALAADYLEAMRSSHKPRSHVECVQAVGGLNPLKSCPLQLANSPFSLPLF